MLTFNPRTYSRIPLSLFSFSAPLPLDASEPQAAAKGSLEALGESREFKENVADAAMAKCCLTGLWQAHNFLEESHELSQAVDTTAGSYWHAILHRREGDYENAKYWFHKVGKNHAVFPQLLAEARALAQVNGERDKVVAYLAELTTWNPDAFVDACAKAVKGESAYGDLVRRVAHFEWEALFDHCYRAAFANDG